MNLTLSLIAGLTLLLPGLSALAAWNFRGAAEGAATAELPLTSATALFAILAISGLLHLAGYWVTDLGWSAALDVSARLPAQARILPVIPRPYETLWSLIEHAGRQAALPGAVQAPDVRSAAVLGLVILAECVLALRLATSPLLELVLDGRDVRQQGWVYASVVRPRRNGFEPIAYVLTTPTQGSAGLGYRGLVVEIRQGADGQLKTVSLSEPEVFVYELGVPPSALKSVRAQPLARMRVHPSRWLGGVVAIEARLIRNIVIKNVPSAGLARVEAELGPDPSGQT